MPSEPIPIRSSATDLLSRMSDRKGSNGESGVAIPYQPAASSSPSSTLSISPQTPFFPPPLASPPLVHGAGLSTTAPSGGFFKWASAFSKSPSIPEGLMGRSPRSSSSSQGSGSESDATPLAQKGFDIPEQNGGINTFGGGLLGPDDIEQESHDSFEVGDLNDIKSRSWNKNRRAVSMSLPRNQSGISAMLGNQFGGGGAGKEASPNGVGGSSVGPNGSMSPPIMPPGGVMADKAAKAQGVMRRISFSGGLSIVSCILGLHLLRLIRVVCWRT